MITLVTDHGPTYVVAVPVARIDDYRALGWIEGDRVDGWCAMHWCRDGAPKMPKELA